MSATQPVRSRQQIRELTGYYLERGETRNHLLIVLGVHTALRISDLLCLTWDDVYDFNRKRFRRSLTITERKTRKPKLITLNRAIVSALHLCLACARQGDPLLKSRKGGAISRIQAYRIIRTAAEELGVCARVSCHSLRKTFGYHAWKSGISPVVIMDIYNHTSFAVTRRYLGLTQDDKDAAYHRVAEIF